MTLAERIQEKILLFDGAMGTMLQTAIPPGSPPELLNIKERDLIKGIHVQYLQAGCDIIETNTFGGSRIKLSAYGLGDLVQRINEEGAALAREVAQDKYVAGAIGPTGKFLEPWGSSSFFEARDIFAEQAAALAAGGADCIIIETMTDLQEARGCVARGQGGNLFAHHCADEFYPDGANDGGNRSSHGGMGLGQDGSLGGRQQLRCWCRADGGIHRTNGRCPRLSIGPAQRGHAPDGGGHDHLSRDS